MKPTTLSRLSGQYLAALRSYMEQSPQADLAAARGLGEQAVALELGTLALAKMHDDALAALLPAGGAADAQEAMTARATEFFAEAHKAVEKTQPARGADGVDDPLPSAKAQSATLLAEAGQLQQHLEALARQILTAQEEERKKMSLMLQDEIAQTLLGIHVRLLALQRQVSAGEADFHEEVAATRHLVVASIKMISGYAGELDIAHER